MEVLLRDRHFNAEIHLEKFVYMMVLFRAMKIFLLVKILKKISQVNDNKKREKTPVNFGTIKAKYGSYTGQK